MAMGQGAPAAAMASWLTQGLPHCCQGLRLEPRPVQREVAPYARCKSTRGRKQEIPTAGFACLNPYCNYFGITDEQRHALVGNGKRGVRQEIWAPTARCYTTITAGAWS